MIDLFHDRLPRRRKANPKRASVREMTNLRRREKRKFILYVSSNGLSAHESFLLEGKENETRV